MRNLSLVLGAVLGSMASLGSVSVAHANPIIIDLVPGPSGNAVNNVVGGLSTGYLYSSDTNGNAKLYRSNGTAAGTALVDSFPAGKYAASLGLYASNAKGLFYQANLDGQLRLHGPTLGSTTLLGSIPGGTAAFGAELPNGAILLQPAGKLLASDGTAAGTNLLATGLSPNGVTVLGSSAFYVTDAGAIGKTDGVTTTAFYAPSGNTPHFASFVTACGGKLYIAMTNAGGLYVSDGVAPPTKLHEAADFYASYMACAVTNLFFRAKTNAAGAELWVSDGTEVGTYLTKDIAVGTADGLADNLQNITVGSGRIYFNANDGTHGVEPWSSDGTAAGTTMLMDVSPGATSGGCDWSTSRTAGGKAYCASQGKFFEAAGATFTDQTASLNGMFSPDRLKTVVVGSMILFATNSVATGDELGVIDTSMALGGGGTVVPPTGDAGAPSPNTGPDASLGSDASGNGGGAGGANPGDGSGGGTTSGDPNGEGATGEGESANTSGCAVASRSRAGTSFSLLPLLAVAALAARRCRRGRRAPVQG